MQAVDMRLVDCQDVFGRSEDRVYRWKEFQDIFIALTLKHRPLQPGIWTLT